MTRDELHRLVAEVQHRRMEPDAIEVKAAHGGTPKVFDSLSALANHPGGGIILFGLDEKQNFKVVGVGNAQRAQEDVANWARNEMEPPVALEFTVDDIDGETVLAIEVQETANAQKPCYYKPKGLRGNGGAYLRAGGTDRPMTDYEIFGYISARGQPRNDEELVADATFDDLDSELLDKYLKKLKDSRPRARYLSGSQEEVLTRLHVCRRNGEVLRPTIAGLLLFGKYPQEFFPQLIITFVQYYGTTEAERTPRGERFLDNPPPFEGSITEMIEQAETYTLSAMRKASWPCPARTCRRGPRAPSCRSSPCGRR
jgi:ATP-dependent DNA helicase RecG